MYCTLIYIYDTCIVLPLQVRLLRDFTQLQERARLGRYCYTGSSNSSARVPTLSTAVRGMAVPIAGSSSGNSSGGVVEMTATTAAADVATPSSAQWSPYFTAVVAPALLAMEGHAPTSSNSSLQSIVRTEHQRVQDIWVLWDALR